MWIIIFLANPIEQNLQEPAPLSNGAEISWDNEIVVVVFLNIDWIWGSLWEAKPMLLSQAYCFGVPSAWCRWCTVHTQSALPTLPYITCSYCAVQTLLSLDPVRLCFWARAPDVLAVGLQHMVAGAHDGTTDGQPHTGLYPGTLHLLRLSTCVSSCLINCLFSAPLFLSRDGRNMTDRRAGGVK